MAPLVPNIWQLQTRGDVDALIEALRHPDAGTRRGAAAALRALGAWQAVPALQEALTLESDWQVHAALTAAIQYLDHDIHVDALIKNKDVRGLSKMLSSLRLDDVVTACRALGTLGDRHAVEPLVMVFRNPMLPDRIRLAAAEALLKLESAPAVVTLLGALRRDDWQVRRNAAAVLGQLKATWATEPLIRTLGDPNPVVRRTAAAALRRMGTSQAMEALGEYEARLREQESELGAGEPLIPSADASDMPQPAPAPVPAPSPVTVRLDVGGEAATGRPKTGRLPTPAAEPEAEKPSKPMIRQLGITPQLPVSGSHGKTGLLPPLPDELPPGARLSPTANRETLDE